MKFEAKTEEEMRELKTPTPRTHTELAEWIEGLVGMNHNYGTCVYAMSLAATAAFEYVAHKLGVTGFQASCADLDVVRRLRGWKYFSVINYEDLLYPQYGDRFDKRIDVDLWEKLQEEAAEKLAAEGDRACEEVRNHWKSIVSGIVPHGFKVVPKK